MAGTKQGGLNAARTNKLLYGEDFYARIGRMGGERGRTGGFASEIPCDCGLVNRAHLVRHCAGKKGGIVSRRSKKVLVNA